MRGPEIPLASGFEESAPILLVAEVFGIPPRHTVSKEGIGNEGASSGRAHELNCNPGYRSRMPLCLTDASNFLLISRLAEKIMIVGFVFSPFLPIMHNLMNNEDPFGFLIRSKHLSISRRIFELYCSMACPTAHRSLELPIFFTKVFGYT